MADKRARYDRSEGRDMNCEGGPLDTDRISIMQ